MIRRLTDALSRWKLLVPVVITTVVGIGGATFVGHVQEIRQRIESTFASRNELTQRFLRMHIEQVTVMRNLFLQAYTDARQPPGLQWTPRPELGAWFAGSAQGQFSGDLAHEPDPETWRQMAAAQGMKPQLDASAALDSDVVWQYFISASQFQFVAGTVDPAQVRFQPAYYSRPYWLQAAPAANPGRRTILAGPYKDLWGKGLLLTIAQPVYADNRFLGIACVDIATDTLSRLVTVGSAVGESWLISENDHLIASPSGGSTGKVRRPPISHLLLEWDEDAEHNLWLSHEVVPQEMWLVHKVPLREIYWAAARESLSNWLALAVLALLVLYFGSVMTLLRQIGKLSFHDALTGLPNRRVLEDRLQQAIASAARSQARVALFFIDLDKFKPVNDRYGHEAGDWLLKQVAVRMRDCLRQSDTVSRVGGDEFVVLLPTPASEAAALAVAEKIRAQLNIPFLRDGLELHISSSIGVAFYPDHAATAQELLRLGDSAMYQAKQGGRDRVVVFRPAADPQQATAVLSGG